MRYLAPYQFGLWLAEYLNIRCQLCGCYRKALPSTLSQPNRLLLLPFSKKVCCVRAVIIVFLGYLRFSMSMLKPQ